MSERTTSAACRAESLPIRSRRLRHARSCCRSTVVVAAARRGRSRGSIFCEALDPLFAGARAVELFYRGHQPQGDAEVWIDSVRCAMGREQRIYVSCRTHYLAAPCSPIRMMPSIVEP